MSVPGNFGRLGTRATAVSLLLLGAPLSGCSGDGGTLGQAFDPDADKRIAQGDEVAVEVVALPGTDTGALNLDRLARTIRERIDRLKVATPASRAARRFELSITISRYDGGQAATPAQTGQTHIDGWRLLTNPDIVARAHSYRDRVTDRTTFAWGRSYSTAIPIRQVEGDFADAMASDLFGAP